MKKKGYIFYISKQNLNFILVTCLVLGFFTGGMRIQRNEQNPLWMSREASVIEETVAETKGIVAIVIDDFGNNGSGTDEMMNIIQPLTFAVIPFLPYSQEEAKRANKAGHEVIVHIPMEPKKGNPKWLGDRGITSNLTSEEVHSIVLEAIEDVQYAVGANNHMGSKITEDKRIMEAVMQVLKANDMYMIDSKTSQTSIVKEVADQYNVPVLERAIFLDNEKNVEAIKRQIEKLAVVALESGSAVAIGHVGPEGGRITAEAIKQMLPYLQEKGIEIMPASKLLNKPRQ
ncbi:protein of unknown function DUF610, YibQ [Alkaliphilus metalliredigens QYMF]|uniref:Divergent polysaccharide deacetylase n=1 Tax=Alkaliphilus metalliredigens (strain QYMF) TaxID=293826 RepID=A6TWE2_ALKMQ|nr:divergent polysaccharide deacetylase family protein [Alkaliphilus metalliredigens]ABR50510.1 protein of unknown function DUF610, YibQ [Alkaliphilus metalliredigens QYMF]